MKIKIIILIFSLILLTISLESLEKVDNYNRTITYRGEISNKARVYSLLGMKKVGADLLLLKQTANIGETFVGNKSFDIEKSSVEISELNPYYLENYYAAANVLAFIKVYLDYESALSILNRGLEYNPEDEYLKKYSLGILAASKGNNDEILKNYEEIVKKYPDPLMIKVIYDIYRDKLKKDKIFEEKYFYYATILYETKNEKYKTFVERDLKDLGYKK